VIELRDVKELNVAETTGPTIAAEVASVRAVAARAVIVVVALAEVVEDSGEVVADADGGGATLEAKSDLPLRGYRRTHEHWV